MSQLLSCQTTETVVDRERSFAYPFNFDVRIDTAANGELTLTFSSNEELTNGARPFFLNPGVCELAKGLGKTCRTFSEETELLWRANYVAFGPSMLDFWPNASARGVKTDIYTENFEIYKNSQTPLNPIWTTYFKDGQNYFYRYTSGKCSLLK